MSTSLTTVKTVVTSQASETPTAGPTPLFLSRPGLRLWTPAELQDRPRPVELVAGVLMADSLAALVGAPGTLKTFTALSLACSVATGQPWGSRAVDPGPVVYVSAEGHAGLATRVAAWEAVHGPAPDCRFVLEAVPLLEPAEVDRLLAAIAELPAQPKLVVIDTLARCFVGGEENSAKDMGMLVAAADRLRRATGACVLLLHHVDQSKGQIRGSTALQGALDTLVKTHRGGTGTELRCQKQKDAAEFAPIRLTHRVVELGDGESSLVVDPVVDAAGVTVAAPKPGLDAAKQRVLRELAAFGGEGASVSDWKQCCAEAGVAKERTFARHKKVLVELGLVHEERQGRGVICRVAGDLPPGRA